MKLKKSSTNKETKIRSVRNAERKTREVKPSKLRPDAFYKGSRFGYAFCDECGTENINVLIDTTLTCGAGHVRTLLSGYVMKSKKQLTQERKEQRAISSIAPVLFFV